MSIVKTIAGRRVVITGDKDERDLELAQGNIVYSSSEMEIASGNPLFKPFSKWLFDAKCILPGTQVIGLKPLKRTEDHK